MALLTDLDFLGQVTLPSAYAKLISYEVHFDVVVTRVAWYISEQARLNLELPIQTEQKLLTSAPEATWSYPLVYAALKQLPEFANAADV